MVISLVSKDYETFSESWIIHKMLLNIFVPGYINCPTLRKRKVSFLQWDWHKAKDTKTDKQRKNDPQTDKQDPSEIYRMRPAQNKCFPKTKKH